MVSDRQRTTARRWRVLLSGGCSLPPSLCPQTERHMPSAAQPAVHGTCCQSQLACDRARTVRFIWASIAAAACVAEAGQGEPAEAAATAAAAAQTTRRERAIPAMGEEWPTGSRSKGAVRSGRGAALREILSVAQPQGGGVRGFWEIGRGAPSHPTCPSPTHTGALPPALDQVPTTSAGKGDARTSGARGAAYPAGKHLRGGGG
jgi:hypothetical protein